MTQFIIDIDPRMLMLAAAAFLLVPLPWCIAVILAALIHEAAHYITVLLLDGKIRSIKISLRGAVMDASVPDPVSECLSILAGPLSSCALSLFAGIYDELAVCGIIHGIYNLLPIFPLDGGRLLQCILLHMAPEKADSILFAVRFISILLIVFLGIYGIYSHIWTITAAAVMTLSSAVGKKPCKADRIKVQ